MVNVIILQALIIAVTVVLACASIYAAESVDASHHNLSKGNVDHHFRQSNDFEYLRGSVSPFYGMHYMNMQIYV